MKKLLCILLIFCLAGCSGTENPAKNNIEISKIETGKSETAESLSEENIFGSFEELEEFLAGNSGFSEVVTDENGKIRLFVPQNLPEKYKLKMIKIHGSYITYFYENPENPAEIFNLEWPFMVTDAKKFLENSLNFSYSEITERPGTYVLPVYSVETGEQDAFKISWIKEESCFSATVSEEVFKNFKNGTDLIKKEIFG